MTYKIWIVVGVVIVAGVGVWISRGPEDTPKAPNQQAQEETQSLKNLLTRSGSWRCTLSQEVQGTATSGIVYLNDGQVRGDFESTVPQYQGPVKSHILVRDGYAFNWTDLSKIGIKVKNTQLETSATPDQNQSEASVDLYNQELGYQCSTWPLDESTFEVPVDISFTDWSKP